MSAKQKSNCGCQHKQAMVDQKPRYDNQVFSRKGIIRPDKRKAKPRFL